MADAAREEDDEWYGFAAKPFGNRVLQTVSLILSCHRKASTTNILILTIPWSRGSAIIFFALRYKKIRSTEAAHPA
ncbi:hypothetical protein DSM19430T_17680 [Desulfovibrio psychrotolerans]|uniref:Uncharacterized protein n=1 Tax=Desulfovibrio psychrotolerans TaxID=415242 RepID=A0A7J0BVQ5_9BACT|nr:hypothetical protein DSM19430T_17680 [Desulfovibrio psychrotolerans]